MGDAPKRQRVYLPAGASAAEVAALVGGSTNRVSEAQSHAAAADLAEVEVEAGGEARKAGATEEALLPAARALRSMLNKSPVGIDALHRTSQYILPLLEEGHAATIRSFDGGDFDGAGPTGFLRYFSVYGPAVNKLFEFVDAGLIVRALHGDDQQLLVGEDQDESTICGARHAFWLNKYGGTSFAADADAIKSFSTDLLEFTTAVQRELEPEILRDFDIDTRWRAPGALEEAAQKIRAEDQSRAGMASIVEARMSVLMQLRVGLEPEYSASELVALQMTILPVAAAGEAGAVITAISTFHNIEMSTPAVSDGCRDSRPPHREQGAGQACVKSVMMVSQAAAEKTHSGNMRFQAMAELHQALLPMYAATDRARLSGKHKLEAWLVFYDFDRLMLRQQIAHPRRLQFIGCVYGEGYADHWYTGRPCTVGTKNACTPQKDDNAAGIEALLRRQVAHDEARS